MVVPLFISLLSCTEDSSTGPEYYSEKLNDAFTQAEQFSGLKSLVVSHKGNIVKEQYWRSGGADYAHDVRSVTKSVTGLLIGIAIDKGFINSVDESIGGYLSELPVTLSGEKANIKIRHLLTMSSGFEWDELTSSSGYINWFNASNQVQYVLNRDLAHQPGEYFTYNSGALHLLSVIINEATNMSTREFAKQYLFDPMGITVNNWETDHQDYNNGGAGLNITPRDMIKIGNLILNEGEYEGNRIVSQSWIARLSHTQIPTNNSQPYGTGYGFCWWTGHNEYGDYAFANGYGGQFIFVVPEVELVITATNDWYSATTANANTQWSQTINLIMESIVTAF